MILVPKHSVIDVPHFQMDVKGDLAVLIELKHFLPQVFLLVLAFHFVLDLVLFGILGVIERDQFQIGVLKFSLLTLDEHAFQLLYLGNE